MRIFKMMSVLLLITLSASAGVRSVGNGGGYAEMLAYLANEKISAVVELCEHSKACSLTELEKKQVAQASNKKFEIVIDSQCLYPVIGADGAGNLTLSACALYDSLDKVIFAKTYQEISVLVLAVRLFADGLDLSDAMNLAKLAVTSVQQEQKSVRVDLESGVIKAHLQRIFSGKWDHTIVSLEGKVHTLNLTEKISQGLQCPEGNIESWFATGLRGQVLDAQTGLAEISVKLLCSGGQKWTGKADVFFETEAGEVNEKSVQIQVHGLREAN